MSNSEKRKKVYFGPIFEMQFVTDMLTMPILDANFVTDNIFMRLFLPDKNVSHSIYEY